MDYSSSSALKNTNFFCRISPARHKSLSNFLLLSISSPRIQSWSRCGLKRRDLVRISASGFRRGPTRRNNTLREKLVFPRDEKVSSLLEIQKASLDSEEFVGNGNDMGAEVEWVEPSSLEDANSNHSSELWRKLETWIDQHKKDSEFWGIGSGPIFTIYENVDGNVVRVLVDEDEILKRSKVRAWSLGQREELADEEIRDLSSRISCAKMIAKEIESGEYRIPKNSSVAKFVIEGNKTSLVEGVRGLSIKTKQFANLFPQFGFLVLGSCVTVWAAAKFFEGNKKVELTRQEAEMLRRKKKARMEKEELEQGSVEVIDNVEEIPSNIGGRPMLNREKLLENIAQAKPLDHGLVVPDTSAQLDIKDPDFDVKVQEIREMARVARELEREQQSAVDEQAEAHDVLSMMLAAKNKNFSIIRDAHAQAHSVRKQSEHDDSSGMNPLLDHENKREVPKNIASIDGEMPNEDSSNECSSKRISSNSDHQEEFNATEVSDAKISSQAILNCKKNAHQKPGPNEKLIKSSVACPSKYPRKAKARVITSVDEARKFLAAKGRISKETKVIEKVAGSPSSSLQVGSGTSGSKSKSNKELPGSMHLKVMDPSALQKLKSTEDAVVTVNDSDASGMKGTHHDQVCITKPHEDSAEINGLTVLNKDINLGNEVVESHPNGKLGESLNFNGAAQSIISESGKEPFSTKITHKGNAQNMESTDTISSRTDILEGKQKTLQEQRRNISISCAFDEKIAPDSQSTFSSKYTDSIVGKVGIKHFSKEFASGGACDDYPSSSIGPGLSGDSGSSIHDCVGDIEHEDDMKGSGGTTKAHPQDSDGTKNTPKSRKGLTAEKSWVEENFQEFNPIIKRIEVGFQKNYMTAKEKVQEASNLSSVLEDLKSPNGNDQLEWMNDDKLREIVLQVRDNELRGRDPFHLMDDNDKHMFFQGLEHIAEKENEKLSGLHEYLHSRIENLHYGEDGISIDDPPSKIFPRWRGPLIGRDPEFLQKDTENPRAILNTNINSENSLQKLEQSISGSISSNSLDQKTSKPANSRTLIECSDGSRRAGKKAGKEHWQHTKKWSQGFIDVYNRESDPEIKSILKDMGKDLDRWITEKEIQESAGVIAKIPKRKRKYIEKKIDKLKEELQLYGQQAVVSKYKEYVDEKEEDYLWWLDLPYILCIELYTMEKEKQKIGFYSLEMAADLELDPKQYHIIAFEDPGDSKNLCYIVQAHLEMLGRGSAFIVARPPKDAFREAKADGFSITVIRKGQLKLNIDQTLEEVDEEIIELGSKMYHDIIMRERSVDMSTLIKGAIAADKPTRRKQMAKTSTQKAPARKS